MEGFVEKASLLRTQRPFRFFIRIGKRRNVTVRAAMGKVFSRKRTPVLKGNLFHERRKIFDRLR